MNAIRTRPARWFALFLVVLAAQSILLGAPGFGIRKKKIELQVRRPALVRLANTAVAFKGSATNPEYNSPLESLKVTLQTELISNEKTIVVKPESEAEWVLGLRVTGFSLPPSQQRVAAGPDKTPVTYVRWTGTVNVAYEVLDKSGRVHDADNVSYAYDKEFNTTAAKPAALFGLSIPTTSTETAPRTSEDIKQILIKEVVQQIATKLGNTTQTIEAQVAGGDDHLNRAGDFLDQRLWARAIEELEKTPEFPRPEDESYRQYNLGLSYEAMSYDSKTYNDQKANLFKAQEYYDKATELNRKEKYFVEMIARTREAVARYRTLDAQQKDDSKKPLTQTTAVSKTPSKATTVHDVIEMFTAGVPNESIIEIIASSPVEFNPLDKDTVVAIAKSKLPIDLQNEMRKKVGATLLNQAPSAQASRP